MSKPKKGSILIFMLIALLFAVSAAAEESNEMTAVSENDGWRNYILVIDNSGSTEVDTASTGPATDPTGLRFEAANALYGALQNDFDRIGVIVFSGGDNYCRAYGPVRKGDPNAWNSVGQYLNKAANGSRSSYTDINYALQEALKMADLFPDGETSIILLSDGANDLTNTPTALTDIQNLQANEATLHTAAAIAARLNTNFYVVALTAGGQSDFRTTFLSFINQLAETGGGYWNEYGMMSNVMEANADGLTENFLRLIGLGEPIRTVTPSIESFVVPYDSVTEATVTITFAMGDRENLDTISVYDPDGARYVLWDRAAGALVKDRTFEVSESQSSITLKIFEPNSGEWKVEVMGVPGTQIEEYVSMSQNVRAALSMNGVTTEGSEVEFRVWLQRYVGSHYEDIVDPAIYQQSSAYIELTSPQSQTVTQYPMTLDGFGYKVTVPLTEAGSWMVGASVVNSILDEKIENYTFLVNEIGDIQGIDIAVSPERDLGDGNRYVDRSAQEIVVSWNVSGEYSALDAVIRPVGGDPIAYVQNQMECRIPRSALMDGVIYEAEVSVLPQNGTDAHRVAGQLQFQLYPAPEVLADLTLSVKNGTTNTEGTYVVEKNDVSLLWDVQGNAEKFVLTAFYPDGTEVSSEYAADVRSCELNLPKNEVYRLQLLAIPAYDDGTTQLVTEILVEIDIPTFMERLQRMLPAIIIAICCIVLLGLVAYAWWYSHRPKVVGQLRISFMESFASTEIKFEAKGKNRLFCGMPLSKHKGFNEWLKTSAGSVPDPVKTLLGQTVINMTKTDEQGRIADEFPQRPHGFGQKAVQLYFGGASINLLDRENPGAYQTLCLANSDAPVQIEINTENTVHALTITYFEQSGSFVGFF